MVIIFPFSVFTGGGTPIGGGYPATMPVVVIYKAIRRKPDRSRTLWILKATKYVMLASVRRR